MCLLRCCLLYIAAASSFSPSLLMLLLLFVSLRLFDKRRDVVTTQSVLFHTHLIQSLYPISIYSEYIASIWWWEFAIFGVSMYLSVYVRCVVPVCIQKYKYSAIFVLYYPASIYAYSNLYVYMQYLFSPFCVNVFFTNRIHLSSVSIHTIS